MFFCDRLIKVVVCVLENCPINESDFFVIIESLELNISCIIIYCIVCCNNNI